MTFPGRKQAAFQPGDGGRWASPGPWGWSHINLLSEATWREAAMRGMRTRQEVGSAQAWPTPSTAPGLQGDGERLPRRDLGKSRSVGWAVGRCWRHLTGPLHNLAEEMLQIRPEQHLPIATGYSSRGHPPPPCTRTARPVAGLVGACPAEGDSS